MATVIEFQERAASPWRPRHRRVFVNGLVLTAHIGVHRHEKKQGQPVRISLILDVVEDQDPKDRLGNVVCYEEIVDQIRVLVSRGHLNLVETLAEDIAQLCLEDPRISEVRVKVEKLSAIEEADSVGVEIRRERTPAKGG